MMKKNLCEILKNWDIENSEFVQKTPSIWEIGERFILKKYEDQNKIDRNVKILQTLIALQIPVAPIIFTCDKKAYITISNNYYLLMEKLPGQHISNIKDKGVGFKIGTAIGQLHIALRQCEKILSFRDNSLLTELEGWVKENFAKSDWKLIKEYDYTNFLEQFRLFYAELPRQLIHRDFHLGNFLFLNGQFTGYIDFDLSQKNIRIFDLCYFLAGLFTEKVGEDLNDIEWLNFVKETVFGYETQIKISENEKLAFPLVMEGIELLCAAYFVGVNNSKFADSTMNNYLRIKKLEKDIISSIKSD